MRLRTCAALLALALHSVSHAQAVCGPYTVALYELGVLFYRDAQGQGQGIDRELTEALSERSGCQLETIVESRVRIWDQLARGQLDISVSGIATPEREQFAEFMPYLRTRNQALIARSLVRQLPSMQAFKADASKRVVVVKGFRYGRQFDAWLDELRAQQRVVEATSFDAAMRMLRAGRAELILTEPINLRPELGPWLKEMVLLDWAPSDDVIANLIVSRSRVSDADRQRLRQALASLVHDGSVDRIVRRHVGDAMAETMRLERGSDNRPHASQPRQPGP